MTGSFSQEFADARPVAQHCAELTWRGPRPEERAETVAAWCRELGSELAQELGQLFSGGKLRVSVSEPDLLAGKQVFERIGPIALNSLLRCGDGDQTMLLSLDNATAIALTDASFGGRGEVPDEAPVPLPRSVAMLVEQCASTIANTIALTNGSAERVRGDVLVRSESATRLKPFSEETDVACFAVTLSMGEDCEWGMLLAVANDRLDGLLPGSAAQAPTSARHSAPSDGTGGAIGTMPLPLEAVLGEIDLTLERLEQLTPGDEIPLAIARDMKLRVGDLVVAHGTIGTFEDRLAVRVSGFAGRLGFIPPSLTQEVAA